MAYTVALANSYGRLISELKRQIETVSQASPWEGLLGTWKVAWGREGMSHLLLSLPQEAQNKVFLAQQAAAMSSANGAL